MKRESRPHGEKEFVYRPHHIDNPEHYRDNYDRIFKKGKYAPCPHDTDGDGDCHICARHPERCIKNQPPQPQYTFVIGVSNRQIDLFIRNHGLDRRKVVIVQNPEKIIGFREAHTIYCLPMWHEHVTGGIITEAARRGWTLVEVTEDQLNNGTAINQ